LLKLNSFTENDIKLFTEWLNKDYIKNWYTHTDDWLNEVLSNEFDFIHHFIVSHDGRPFGFCQYYDYSLGGEDWHGAVNIKNTYSIDYLIGEKDYLGKGFGTKIVMLLTEKIFEETTAVQIIVQPEKDNQASRRTLISAGYSYDDENDIFVYKRGNLCR